MEVLLKIIDQINNYIIYASSGAGIVDLLTEKLQKPIDTLLENAEFVAIYNSFAMTGFLLMTVFLLLDLLDKVTMANFNPEILFKTLSKFVLAMFFVNNGLVVIRALNGIGTYMVELVLSGTIEMDTVSTLIEKPDTTNWFWGIILLLFAIVKAIFTKGFISSLIYGLILRLVLPVAAASRIIRLSYNCLLLPFAVADITGNGMRMTAIAKIKRLLGIFLEYPIIVIAMLMSKEVSTGVVAAIVMGFNLTKMRKFANDIATYI